MPFAGSKSIKIFSGNCTDLIYNNEDSSCLRAYNLLPGQDYYIVVDKIDTGYSYFNFTVKIDTNSTFYKTWSPNDCQPADCNNHIMNPGFTQTPDYTFGDSFDEEFTFELNHVCGWHSLTGSPNLTFEGNDTDSPFAKLWAVHYTDPNLNYVRGETIEQYLANPLLNNTNYQITFDWRNISAISTANVDELCIYFVNPSYILPTINQINWSVTDLKNALDGQLGINAVRVGATDSQLLNAPGTWWTWTPVSLNYYCTNPNFSRLIVFPYDMDDVSTGVMVNIDNFNIQGPGSMYVTADIQHSCAGKDDGAIELTLHCGTPPYSYEWSNNALTEDISGLDPGTYTVTVTDAYTTITSTFNIIYAGYPQQPDLGHYVVSNCGAVNPLYTILNPEPNVEYTWSLNPSNAGNFVSGINTGNDVNIEWTNVPALPNQTEILITCHNPNTNCTKQYSFEFNNICLPQGLPPNTTIYVCNTTSSDAGLSGTYANKTIVVNGSFEINTNNLIFSGCTFLMGPLAYIKIMPNVTTTFNNLTSIKGDVCLHMWDGIYIETSSSKIIMNQSTVSDAINGLISRNGGQIQLYESTLNKNYYCIKVENFPPGNDNNNINFSMKKCTLQGNTLLYQPFANTLSRAGVSLNRVGLPYSIYGIIIGSPTVSTDKNYFQNLKYGILSRLSNVKIYNNDFSFNVQDYISNAIDINAESNSNNSVYPRYTAIIGGTGTYEPNTFNKYFNGIEAAGNMNLSIKLNTFTSCKESLHFCNFGKVSPPCSTNLHFDDNTITNGLLYGIIGGGNSNCNTYITCNKISMLGSNNGTVGINITGSANNNNLEVYTINSNTIKAVNGITVLRAYMTNMNFNSITMYNNAFTTYSYGILMQDCDYQYIYNTTIGGTTDIKPTRSWKCGISIENTIHPLYKCNIINTTDRAFNIVLDNANNLATISIFKNTFKNSNYGMVKSSSGRIGNQGNTTTPWLNMWDNVTTHTSGSGINDVCWARSLPLENFTPTPWVFTKQLVTCNPCTVPACPFGVSCNTLGGLINGSSETNENIQNPLAFDNPAYITQNNIISNSDNLNEIAWYMAKQKVYAQMISDKDTYMLDAGFSSFITNCNNNSVGLLYSADKYIGMANIDSAEIFNNNVTITNIADSVHKFVNTKYIMYLRNKELSNTDLEKLHEIALLCPFEFGDGVYIARGLLNIADTFQMIYTNICETNIGNQKSILNEDIDIDELVNMQLSVYPNPAKDLVNIEYTNTEDNIGSILFIVYDLMGKKLLEKMIMSGESAIVSTESLVQGVYVYKFLHENKIVKKDKLVIIK